MFLYTISQTKTNFITASEKSLGLHYLSHKDTHETPLVFSASFLYTMMLGSKGLLPPTDAYELLRCKAAPAILYICPRKKDAAVEKTLSTMTSKEMKNDSSFTNSCSYSDVQAWNLKTEQEISE